MSPSGNGCGVSRYESGHSAPRLMVEQPGATCPGHQGVVVAGLGQVRHRLGSGEDLADVVLLVPFASSCPSWTGSAGAEVTVYNK